MRIYFISCVSLSAPCSLHKVRNIATDTFYFSNGTFCNSWWLTLWRLVNLRWPSHISLPKQSSNSLLWIGVYLQCMIIWKWPKRIDSAIQWRTRYVDSSKSPNCAMQIKSVNVQDMFLNFHWTFARNTLRTSRLTSWHLGKWINRCNIWHLTSWASTTPKPTSDPCGFLTSKSIGAANRKHLWWLRHSVTLRFRLYAKRTGCIGIWCSTWIEGSFNRTWVDIKTILRPWAILRKTCWIISWKISENNSRNSALNPEASTHDKVSNPSSVCELFTTWSINQAMNIHFDLLFTMIMMLVPCPKDNFNSCEWLHKNTASICSRKFSGWAGNGKVPRYWLAASLETTEKWGTLINTSPITINWLPWKFRS